MKPKKNRKPTPEEALRRFCEEGMGLSLTYDHIQSRLDTAEIARVGAVRQASAKAGKTPAPNPSPRRAAPAVLLVLAVLILTPALAVGSFLIARSTMDPAPPHETGGMTPPIGTDPYPGLIPGRPAESEPTIVTPRPIAPNGSGEAWSNLFNLSESYSAELGFFLRAEHLDPHAAEGALPAALTISELAEWKSFFGEVFTDGAVPSQGLLDSLNGLTWDFFAEKSLLVVVTEGRSGSIRYRLDEIHTDDGTMTLELVAEVPPALTMDIAHWCVIVPVSKDAADLPVELAFRDEPTDRDDTNTEIGPDPAPYPGILRFGNDSYTQNGVCYGRLGQTPTITELPFPRTEAVHSLAAWQSLCGNGESDTDFLAALEAFDQDFFEEHSLIILYLREGSGSIRHRVDRAVVEGDSLHIRVTSLHPATQTCDMAYWAILIPLDKKSAALPVGIELDVEVIPETTP